MFTKKLTPAGKVFTKQVGGFLEEMLSEANPVTVVVYSKKAISEEWLECLRTQDGSVRLVVLDTLLEHIPAWAKGAAQSVETVTKDMSNQIHAIFYSHSERYLLINTRDVMAGSFSENPQAEELVEKIMRHVAFLK